MAVPRSMVWRAGEQDKMERREREKCIFIASKAVGSVLGQSHGENSPGDIYFLMTNTGSFSFSPFGHISTSC